MEIIGCLGLRLYIFEMGRVAEVAGVRMGKEKWPGFGKGSSESSHYCRPLLWCYCKLKVACSTPQLSSAEVGEPCVCRCWGGNLIIASSAAQPQCHRVR